jgi:hypothetical protein
LHILLLILFILSIVDERKLIRDRKYVKISAVVLVSSM